MRVSFIAIASCLLAGVDAFIQSICPTRSFIAAKSETITKLRIANVFEISVDMPPSNSGLQANMKFKSKTNTSNRRITQEILLLNAQLSLS